MLFYKKPENALRDKWRHTYSEISQLEVCVFYCICPDCGFCLVFKRLYKNCQGAPHFVPGSAFLEALALTLGCPESSACAGETSLAHFYSPRVSLG